MYLGIHVSSAGGIENAIKNGEKYGVNTIQMMPTAPMRWATKLIPDEDIENFVNELENSNIKKILIHGIYLTNLARGDKKLFHLGKMGLVVYLDFAEKVAKQIKERNIDSEMLGVCFHPGSQQDLDYDESMERISYGIQWVLDEVQGDQKLLIETTAGTGKNLGRNFEELTKMREGVEDKERVGYVLDTQHTFASGYDWVNDFDSVVEDIEDILGLENVKSIHLNDSLPELGTNKDRHANLGEGKIGKDTFRKILKYEKFKDMPFVLETPAMKSPKTIEKEVEVLRELAK
jgi:deoxyribonuclease IV